MFWVYLAIPIGAAMRLVQMFFVMVENLAASRVP
jgi:TRAP-type C4-dicarboxylate transport system permease small subunit